MSGFDSVVSDASNIRIGGGADITYAEFVAVYPQFVNSGVPQAFVEMMLTQANASIQEARWHTSRKLAVCLYVAHFCTMWMRSNGAGSSGGGISSLTEASSAPGTISSVSVDGLSVSYSNSESTSDLAGFGSMKDTAFGQQFASLSKMVCGGMMVVR